MIIIRICGVFGCGKRPLMDTISSFQAADIAYSRDIVTPNFFLIQVGKLLFSSNRKVQFCYTHIKLEFHAQKRHYNTDNVNSILHEKTNVRLCPKFIKKTSLTILLSAFSWTWQLLFLIFIWQDWNHKYRGNICWILYCQLALKITISIFLNF